VLSKATYSINAELVISVSHEPTRKWVRTGQDYQPRDGESHTARVRAQGRSALDSHELSLWRVAGQTDNSPLSVLARDFGRSSSVG
jgi:hypothetical protein